MKTEYAVNRYLRLIFYTIALTILVGFVCMECLYPSEREPGTEPESLIYDGTLVWDKPDGTREEI